MFEFEKTAIEDVILIKPQIFGDERGFFAETYKKSAFEKAGISANFVQDNHSKSTKGVLRGLHYQAEPKAQAKLVRCTCGEIFDVAVDLRPNSSTFKKWVRVKLSAQNKHMLLIPKGFAHGFVVLSDCAELMYKTDEEYSPTHDRSLFWADETIGVDWGIDFEPILSQKDLSAPHFNP